MPRTIGHDMSLEKAREMMNEMRCHHLPVLDGGHLVGVLSDRDLKVGEAMNGQKKRVEDLMMDDPIIVDPELTVKEAVQTLLKEKVGSLIVRANPEKSPWGIFTVTDALKILDDKLNS